LEISNQPELWIFSNLLIDEWVAISDLSEPFYEKRVTIPISLPQGTAIFKLETDGTQGQVISVSIAHNSEIQLFQLINPDNFNEFRQKVLEYVKKIYPDNFDYYSYLKSFYTPKMRDFGLTDILGIETDIKDLADHGVKSRMLQRFPDPIQGYEVPEHWQVNKNLGSIVPKNQKQQRTIIELRRKICDRLAKHAVIEGLRCAIIALKHYASLLDELTSDTRINSLEEHQTIADGLYELGEYQNAAIFYSKCLSSPSFDDKEKLNRILSILRASIQQMEPQEFLEYALFAAKIARSHRDE
jgi:tetratricopeptide (TPR) repeat protein